MNILVIGTGGREHALCKKLSESPIVDRLYCTAGNAGIEKIAESVPIKPTDITALAAFAKKHTVDLTVVGPEAPLCAGITDTFQKYGLPIFGPNAAAARLEGSKEFSKKFMEKYGIPTARYTSAKNIGQAQEALHEFDFPVVIKADGLCAGKGVFICNDAAAAESVLSDIFTDRIFGSEGSSVVIEEFLEGTELSQLCIVSHNTFFPLESAQDYKKIGEGDTGANTGGMGCVSPNPALTLGLQNKINAVLKKIADGFVAEGMDFTGILFIGFMLHKESPKVLEFNVRFGDPETQVLMLRLDSDLAVLLTDAVKGTLTRDALRWKSHTALTIVCTSAGYPQQYHTGCTITGLDSLDENITVFHSGTKKTDRAIVTAGGRVLCVSTTGNSIETCRTAVLKNISRIHFDGMYYRTDIGG